MNQNVRPDNKQAEQQHWDNRYKEHDTPWQQPKVHDVIKECCKLFANKRAKILEIGCGTGIDTVWIAQQGHQVTAIDISKVAINEAKDNARNAKASINFMVADFMRDKLKLPTFDIIYDAFVFHLEAMQNKRLEMVNKIAAMLTPQGYWFNLSVSDYQTDLKSQQANVDNPPMIKFSDLLSVSESRFQLAYVKQFQICINRKEQGNACFNAWASVWQKKLL